jgi:hypothetical protein
VNPGPYKDLIFLDVVLLSAVFFQSSILLQMDPFEDDSDVDLLEYFGE